MNSKPVIKRIVNDLIDASLPIAGLAIAYKGKLIDFLYSEAQNLPPIQDWPSGIKEYLTKVPEYASAHWQDFKTALSNYSIDPLIQMSSLLAISTVFSIFLGKAVYSKLTKQNKQRK